MKRSAPKHNCPSRDDLWRTEWLEPQQLCSAWALAERFEALIRVFNDPAAYAKRLATRLHAKPEPIKNAMRAPPKAVNRIDQTHRRVRGRRLADAFQLGQIGKDAAN
ncbi:hypothetical protein [Candidatus Viadribacter manganicus]|uniref:Uncharacterized protein n=1 Tax=Candidatus Viadribacter manganicus TaxID=1759059 RepID=A0A1B1AID1_9PROT|nr:hypothetical protein [Candidatus Viadribacter manganicus]ANP46326.1 hypothetical protein ATE48_10560 [Candidatus Viadribacter manganicus]